MNDAAATHLFPALLGERFHALPARVQALHCRFGTQRLHGEVDVVRGPGWLSRLCAWATRLPPAGRGPIEVEIAANAAGERWTRRIAGHAMRSRLWADDGLLRERLGLVTFGFRLTVEDGAILWRVVRASALGVPLPAAWFAGVSAREFGQEDRYCFDVAAALPWAGLLVRYRGWLHVD